MSDVAGVVRWLVAAKLTTKQALDIAAKVIPNGIKSATDFDGEDAGEIVADAVKDAALRKKILAKLKGGKQEDQRGEKRSREAASAGKSSASKRAKTKAPAKQLPTKPSSSLTEDDLNRVEIRVNRAPVMILWAAAVAERRGYRWDEALSIGRAAADWFAQRKGEYLGILEPESGGGGGSSSAAAAAGEPGAEGAEGGGAASSAAEAAGDAAAAAAAADTSELEILGLDLELVQTGDGWRALSRGKPTSPTSAAAYVTKAFGERLPAATAALSLLAASLPEADLEFGRRTYVLYERFRPAVASGTAGWGQKGFLKLSEVLALRGSAP